MRARTIWATAGICIALAAPAAALEPLHPCEREEPELGEVAATFEARVVAEEPVDPGCAAPEALPEAPPPEPAADLGCLYGFAYRLEGCTPEPSRRSQLWLLPGPVTTREPSWGAYVPVQDGWYRSCDLAPGVYTIRFADNDEAYAEVAAGQVTRLDRREGLRSFTTTVEVTSVAEGPVQVGDRLQLEIAEPGDPFSFERMTPGDVYQIRAWRRGDRWTINSCVTSNRSRTSWSPESRVPDTANPQPGGGGCAGCSGAGGTGPGVVLALVVLLGVRRRF